MGWPELLLKLGSWSVLTVLRTFSLENQSLLPSAVFSPSLLFVLSASTLCIELALNVCGFCDRVPAWVDLEDSVKVHSAKHLLHLIKSKLLLIQDGLWGMARSSQSIGRRVEGPEGHGAF